MSRVSRSSWQHHHSRNKVGWERNRQWHLTCSSVLSTEPANPVEAIRIILGVMITQGSFCFSLMQDDFSKASGGQDATNTAIKPLQHWGGRGREGLGGNQAYRLSLSKATRWTQLLVLINSSSSDDSSPELSAPSTDMSAKRSQSLAHFSLQLPGAEFPLRILPPLSPGAQKSPQAPAFPPQVIHLFRQRKHSSHRQGSIDDIVQIKEKGNVVFFPVPIGCGR